MDCEIETSVCPVDCYCVAMCSWTDCPGNADAEPLPERELLPPTVRPQPTARFALASDQELDKLAEGLVPENTAKITNRATKCCLLCCWENVLSTWRSRAQLQLSQLKRFEDKYVYYENVSKNRNGSFKQLV